MTITDWITILNSEGCLSSGKITSGKYHSLLFYAEGWQVSLEQGTEATYNDKYMRIKKARQVDYLDWNKLTYIQFWNPSS